MIMLFTIYHHRDIDQPQILLVRVSTIQHRQFFLCVDDFGIKHFSDEGAHHLLKLLQKYYSVTVDMEGKTFCGLKFDWNYDDGYV